MKRPEIVLLGGPNSGKTHYAGQLYGRLQHSTGALTLRKSCGAPDDLSLLHEVLSCLENGNAAQHTSTGAWGNVHLPLTDSNGREFDLNWPDYGGEQLKRVFATRSVDQDWQNRLINANGWVLLIRLNTEATYPDAIENLVHANAKQDENESRANSWDANAYWVEKLQILLHVAKIGWKHQIQAPPLTVLLSCYDEVGDEHTPPIETLCQKLPLVASFIQSNWNKNSVSVWGLSALGQELVANSQSDDFIDEGPESQGWVLPPEGGEKSTDLTLPLMWLLERVSQ